jgi:3-methyladenine DNA glycosylase Tag
VKPDWADFPFPGETRALRHELRSSTKTACDPLYVAYHDTNGACRNATTERSSKSCCSTVSRPGLSWITILRKRENFRRAFDGFDPERSRATTRATQGER